MPKRKRIAYEWDDDDDDDDDDEFSHSDWGWFKPSRPRKVEGGIKARSGARGKFGETWWAGKWVSVLESFGWSNRLQRGRSYARGGQVLDIRVKSGVVHARVQGSRPTPYNV